MTFTIRSMQHKKKYSQLFWLPYSLLLILQKKNTFSFYFQFFYHIYLQQQQKSEIFIAHNFI